MLILLLTSVCMSERKTDNLTKIETETAKKVRLGTGNRASAGVCNYPCIADNAIRPVRYRDLAFTVFSSTALEYN